MFIKSNLLKIISLLLICLINFPAKGQRLINSRESSYYTYIYKLTDKEAASVYRKNLWSVDPSFFHTLVDSFVTDNGYTGKLAKGHYLKTFSEGNRQQVLITSVPDFDVKILNNNTDLCVQVYDLEGRLVTDADVKLHMKKLRFDAKTQAYVDRKSNRKGLLKVSRNGFSTWYDVSRMRNNSAVKRGTRKVVYGTPLKYIWIPVRYVIYLPIDGVKSVVHGYTLGTIGRTKNFFVKCWDKLMCLFDDTYCNDYYNYRSKHKGYLVFNKPMYRPGDTLKFKAYIVTKKGKPITAPIRVELWTGIKTIQLTKLNPYTEGGFEYQFFLHDSLNLQLDKSYSLFLRDEHDHTYLSESFQFEDYELNKNKLEIRTGAKVQYKDKPFSLYVKGTDENNLNLPDGRLEIWVRPKDINQCFDTYVFVPDTILNIKKALNADGETEIIIPDSAFPKANFKYRIDVKLLTSDNEAITKSEDINYFYSKKEFDLKLLADSVSVTYLENGNPKSKAAKVLAVDNFGNETLLSKSNTPFKVWVSPYYQFYKVIADSLVQSLNISKEPSLIRCLSERNLDSIRIVVENPRKLPFTYNIYKRNNETGRGYGDSLSLTTVNPGKQNYFISIRYLWGGIIKEENYRIPYIDKTLTVTVKQPKIVFPGQKTLIEVYVTDKAGKPVQGVDLTAYSLTKKFTYSAPELPYLGKPRKDKSLINNFTLKGADPEDYVGLQLDYDAWKKKAGIDSIEYYKFIYPGKQLYRFEYEPKDSITQFAPFVISNGYIEPVHVIYVDNKPVYFSWSTNVQPYSFRINPGHHQVKLRTRNQLITIDSLYISLGKKLVFSLNHDLVQKNIRSEKADPKLSEYEKQQLYRYIFPYRNNFGEKYAYINNFEQVISLKSSKNNYQPYNLAGPVSGITTFTLIDDFTTTFTHEPDFEYDFKPGLLKMRSVKEELIYPKYIPYNYINQDRSDLVLTKRKIESQWSAYQDAKRQLTARYSYPKTTMSGAGMLQISFIRPDSVPAEQPLNVLLFRYDNLKFLRIYPGNTTQMHQLAKGLYKLLFFYSGAKYHIADSINIQTDGTNFQQIVVPQSFKKDDFSKQVSKIIEESLFKTTATYPENEKELKQVYDAYQQQFAYTGEGDIIEGYVRDEAGEGIPGVTVLVKGTTYGVLTDLDGHYSLKLPPGHSMLSYSFVGFEPLDVNANGGNVNDVRLKESAQALDEVVVTAFGITRQSLFTASATTVSSNSIPGLIPENMSGLEGKVSGIQINNGSPGSGVSIQIRGVTTTSFDNKPLFVINGIVFTGDISELDPALIEKIEVLKSAEATSLYGAQAANGVIIITTKSGAFKPTADKNTKGTDYDNAFFEAASKSSSIRENFSDYAFWQPKLTTDKNGKATFEVTFPDDVTSWNTYYLAMNGNKQTGQSGSQIKSYKPLMAQLAVPRFLVKSDTSYAIGKALNYSPDSLTLTTHFEVNSESVFSKKQACINSVIDTLQVTALNDSLKVKYFLEKEDGYFDGEQKTIPVFPVGLEVTKGSFQVLQRDTTFRISADSALGMIRLNATAGMLDVLTNEIDYLAAYRYLCNEQLASKLKALLSEKLICTSEKIKFENDGSVEKLISLLLKSQESNGLWGWWKNANTSYWISLHALEALYQARAMGFNVKLDENKLTDNMIWELDNNQDFADRIKILKIMRLLNLRINYTGYITEISKVGKLSFNNQLQLMELKQLCNIPISADSLKPFQQLTMFGNIYFSDKHVNNDIQQNDIQNTILAYRILRNDSLTDKATLAKIRNYFLEERRNGYWQNTYESAQIIETILPDLLGNNARLDKPELTISGDISKTVKKFPFEMKLEPGQKVSVSKTGDLPVYFTSYQRYWNAEPERRQNDFIITTTFEHNNSSLLKAGKETKLIVNLVVKKDADYVMLNIPIPGGCTYSEKGNNFANEVHREYFKYETAIFCQKLRKGEYKFEISLMPRYSGKYTLNPAKAELMYFPTFNANNALKKVTIE